MIGKVDPFGELLLKKVLATLPYLKPEQQRNLLEVLSLVLKKTLPERRPKTHSLLELEGLGAESWKKVDIEEYVRQERNTWD